MEHIADAATDDLFRRLNAEIRNVAEKLGQGERDAIAALMGRAMAERVGIEVLRGSYSDGETMRWKTTVALNPDVPFGEIRYRSGITKMTGTDVPPRTWGVNAVLAHIAKARRTTRRGGYRALPGPAEPRGLPPIPPRPSKGGATTAR